MPIITETIEISLLCSDFRFLRDEAEKSGLPLDEYISKMLTNYVNMRLCQRSHREALLKEMFEPGCKRLNE